MHDLISVIVVTYNSSKTVLETLDSIKNQTYENIELIVTDDCSKDSTVDLVSQWINVNRSRFNGCNLLTVDKNTGVSGNVIRGIQAARGEYYKNIAGDDLLKPNAIEVFRKTINLNDKIIYQAKIISFYDTANDKVFSDKTNEFDKINAEFLGLNQKEQYKRLLKGNVLHAPGMGLIRLHDYNSVGGIDRRYSMIEDYPLWIKLSEAGFVFRPIEDTLIEYRISSASLSHHKPVKYLLNEADIFFDYCLKRLLNSRLYVDALIRVMKYSLMKIYLFLKKFFKENNNASN